MTEIETLVRDPYSIYARHVLGLRPFEALAEAPGAPDRGAIVHEAFEEIAAAFDRGAPPSEDELDAIGARRFARIRAHPDLYAFWWPRFRRAARWFAAYEAACRARGDVVTSEASGEIAFDLPGGRFVLRGRADRFERRLDGTVAVVDFKTGRVPSAKQVRAGLCPQLPLEAAMLTEGAFAHRGLAAQLTPAALVYVVLGSGDPAGETRGISPKQGSVEDFARSTLAHARQLLARFDDPAQPYLSLAASPFRLQFGEYDHLARVREWGVATEREEP